MPIKLTKVADAPSLGCAILAATATGVYPGIAEAVGAMVHVTRVIEPDHDAHAAYRPHLEAYRRAYPALKSIFDEGAS